MPWHIDFVRKACEAERYFKNKNDILYGKKRNEIENAIRNSDNRIPTNFFGLLVRQKAAYMFTYPPIIDTGSKNINDKIYKLLGDKYTKACKDLCINAANTGVGWLHVWRNKKDEFKYSVVDSKQIIPIWSSELMDELSAVFRTYIDMNDNGERFRVYEYWNDIDCFSFKKRENDEIDNLISFDIFKVMNNLTESVETTNVYKHKFNAVPFIPFFNNNEGTGDLDNVKALIDAYDKVFSGFLNDLEDIQEIIFILKGYNGTELDPFLNDLKKYKTIKLDGFDGSGLETLTISIPVEARKEMLSICRKAIFEQGQGVDPDQCQQLKQNVGIDPA